MIDALGVQSLTYEISAMVDPLMDHFPEMSNIRKGNIMARARMIVLYDQSVAFNGLAVGTGNKTEILLGYTTLYGDSACAINPIGDLYKTQVRQLSRALGVPEAIIAKPPSADLWIGQTDEGELGYTYAEVDRLLYLLVDQRYLPGRMRCGRVRRAVCAGGGRAGAAQPVQAHPAADCQAEQPHDRLRFSVSARLGDVKRRRPSDVHCRNYGFFKMILFLREVPGECVSDGIDPLRDKNYSSCKFLLLCVIASSPCCGADF